MERVWGKCVAGTVRVEGVCKNTLRVIWVLIQVLFPLLQLSNMPIQLCDKFQNSLPLGKKHILRIQIVMLGFFTNYKKTKQKTYKFLVLVAFFTTVPKNGPGNGSNTILLW